MKEKTLSMYTFYIKNDSDEKPENFQKLIRIIELFCSKAAEMLGNIFIIPSPYGDLYKTLYFGAFPFFVSYSMAQVGFVLPVDCIPTDMMVAILKDCKEDLSSNMDIQMHNTEFDTMWTVVLNNESGFQNVRTASYTDHKSGVNNYVDV